MQCFGECILDLKQDIPVHLFVSPAYFIAAVFFWVGVGGGEKCCLKFFVSYDLKVY